MPWIDVEIDGKMHKVHVFPGTDPSKQNVECWTAEIIASIERMRELGTDVVERKTTLDGDLEVKKIGD